MDRLLLTESRMSTAEGSAPVPGFIQLMAVAAMTTVAAVRNRTGIILVRIFFD
jgi:hypothetical protein